MVATGVDFGVMVALVEGVAVSPVAATAVGATAGAVTNFALGRTWIFGSTSGAVSGQIGRYALASAASAALNALGEHIVHDLANVRYLLARALVALAVGVLWNFPMHRHFVFR